MTVLKLSALAAGVIGGAMTLSGATPASAATLAPALAQTGDKAMVQEVTHDPRARSYNQNLWRNRNYSGYQYGNRYGRSGPSVSLGLSVPGFSFGIGTPRAYTYGNPGYGYGYPSYGYGYPGYYGYGY